MKKRKKIFYFLVLPLGIPLLLLVIFFLSIYFGFFGSIPTTKDLKAFQNELASQVYSSDGKLLGKFYAKNRTNIKYSKLPDYLVHALVATEDARFFEHKGVDSRSLLRVVIKSILMGDKSAGGGSTISQQLAKNMFGRKDYGFLSMPVNKSKEIILADRIENIYSKQEIITQYFNTVPFGGNVYGIEAASRRFFNKKTKDISIEEAAILVGMLKANTYYNPKLHPENALTRRNVVLKQMVKYEYINESTYNTISTHPITLNYANLKSEGIANYFLVNVKKETTSIIDSINKTEKTKYNIEKDGLLIETTLNNALQEYALIAFKEHLSKMQKLLRTQYLSGRSKKALNKLTTELLKSTQNIQRKNTETSQLLFNWDDTKIKKLSVEDSIKEILTMLHAGMIALHPKTGAIKTYIGGIDFSTQPFDQIKAKRQLASSFKPIIYASAIEHGRAPCEYISNRSIALTDYEGWSPQNYDHSSGGKYSLAAALAKSMNIPTIYLYFEEGYNNINTLWQKLGFSNELKDQPAISLGTAEANILEVAAAYSSFVNKGSPVTPFTVKSIKTKDGKVIYKHKTIAHKPAFSERTSFTISKILQKAITEGTGTSLRSRYGVTIPLAGKTGTSQNYADAWFTAFNPNIIWVARVGANSPSIHFNNGRYGTGGSLALPLVAKTLAKAQKDKNVKKEIYAKFSQKYSPNMYCDDFMEDTPLEEIINIFRKKETTLQKEKRRAKRKSFFRKLFGK